MMPHLLTVVLAATWLAAEPEPLQWESSYGKALSATRADDQPLLVVLDKPAAEKERVAPEFLAPAAPTEKEALLLQPYRLCHVDVTTDYGERVAEAFKAQRFPFVAVIDKTGSVILASKTGKIEAGEWERMLTTHKSGERSTAVSRVSYKPNGTMIIQNALGASAIGGSSCPTCRR